jgi:hypothetical protein
MCIAMSITTCDTSGNWRIGITDLHWKKVSGVQAHLRPIWPITALRNSKRSRLQALAKYFARFGQIIKLKIKSEHLKLLSLNCFYSIDCSPQNR